MDARGQRRLFRWLVVGALLAGVIAFSWPSKEMVSRDIGCARVDDGRPRELCNAIASSMQWTWMGHAIVSPGWRVTWSGIRDVYCRQHVGAVDLPALRHLAQPLVGDWRLQDGAEDLVHIVQSVAGSSEPATSIFNPRNPSYILKRGCG